MTNHTPEPCPWCGCKEIKISFSEICCPIKYSARARCTECDAEEPIGSGVFYSKEDAEREAWESWNYRPMGNLAAVTAQRDDLKAEADYVLRECKEPEALNDQTLNLCNVPTGIRDLRADFEDAKAQRDELLATMRILACLGNGDAYGNSDGNIIAQEAIAKCEVK